MPYLSTMKHRDALWICKLRKEKVSKMKKKFAIILALFLIAVVCSAGCIDPETPVDPVDPVVPVDPVDPVTPVDPVVPEEPVDPVVPAEGDFTVTFMMNSAVDSGVYLTVYVDEGEAVAEPAVPEKPKAQYIFVQWTTDKENKHAYDFTTPVTADLVLYADWDVKGTSSGSGHSHSYTATVTTEETCGANGVKTYTCSCGASYTEVILATGSHSYGPWVDGKQTCSVCGYVVTCEHPATALSGTNIVCTVCNENLGAVVAQIGNNYYASFESAMENAVPDEDTIILHAAVQNGVVNKKVVIDTNDNETSLVYDETKGLTVADIKIVKNTVTNKLGTVMFGGEKVVFEVDADGKYVASNEGYLVVAYTVTGTTYTVYTKNGKGLQMALDAINAAGTGDFTVNLAADITGDVTVEQKENVGITINGHDKTFDGAITIDGGSGAIETAKLTINNFKFVAASLSVDAFINLGISGDSNTRYTNHVTVNGCTFTETDNGAEIVAIKSYTGGDKNLVLEGCTVHDSMHSLLQVTNVKEGLKITGCKVYSKNGINLNHCYALDMSNCEFDVKGYAVRFGVNSGGDGTAETYRITNCKLKTDNSESDPVIIFRSTAQDATLTLTDTTLEGNSKISGDTVDTTITIDGARYVSSAAGLAAAVAAGEINIWLADGEYDVYDCGSRTLTISGTKNAVLKVAREGSVNEPVDYGFDSSTVTFNGVTIETLNGSFDGYARLTGTYNNCIFENNYCLYGDSEFNTCEFNVEGNQYNIWTWGAPTATFTGCTFNCDGKAVLLYGTENTKLTMNNCVFNDNGDDTVTGKAAIEIGNDYSKSYELIVNKATVNGFAVSDKGIATGTTLWANKNEMGTDKLNVVIDGADVY